MVNYLKDHALSNIHCAKQQDKQFLFKPALITIEAGVRHTVEIEWEHYPLPGSGKWFVYQIGQLAPSIVDLFPMVNSWFTIENKKNTLIDVYDTYGKQFPKNDTFLMRTVNKNFVLAVKDNNSISNLPKNSIFIRFYTNAFFKSKLANSDDKVFSYATQVFTRQEVVIFQNKVEKAKQENIGHVYLFQNGWKVKNIHPDHFEPMDILEYVIDSSIKEVVEFKINELEIFTSDLDRARKYLLFRDTDSREIDFRDDIDLFVVGKDNINGHKGVFYHKFSPVAFRMLTHKDYSIPVNSISFLTNMLKELYLDDDLYIVMHIRKSGIQRQLTFESNKIHELMKLGKTEILNAMVGTNSNLETWKAANLELSKYPKLMNSLVPEIDNVLIQEAYGYNASSKVLGDTPSKPVLYNGLRVVDLPPKLRYNSSLFEYSKLGLLINSYNGDEGKLYKVKNDHTGYVEGMVGKLSKTTGFLFNVNRVDIPNYNQQIAGYYSDMINGLPTYDWQYATEDLHYKIIDQQVIWLLDPKEFYLATKVEAFNLHDSFELGLQEGYLKFDIESEERYFINGKEFKIKSKLDIPPGKIDIFLNSHSLIKDLDYYISWPTVLIVNKEFINQSKDKQLIDIRLSGLCDYDLKLQPMAEHGFIEHGLLSRNDRYDLRDDRVLRFVSRGRIYSRDEIDFSEENNDSVEQSLTNGSPYQVDDIFVPLDEFLTISTYDYKNQSNFVNKQVSDYLSLYKTEPVIDKVSIITKRYDLYSPFISRVIMEMVVGNISPTSDYGNFRDDYVREIVKDLVWLFKFDPLIQGFNQKYVKVHPHHKYNVIEITQLQYNFLSKLNKIYFNDSIDLSGHISITRNE